MNFFKSKRPKKTILFVCIENARDARWLKDSLENIHLKGFKRLTYNALNILEIRFPQQVKRTKSDLKKQIQKMAIGLDDSESMKRILN